MSLANFFAMGGQGFYVWGSYAATALLIAVEVVIVRSRLKAARAQAVERAK
jgi:heme exporter protein D